MKKLMMLGFGIMIGLVASEYQCIKKPMKQALKKINIE